MSLIPLNQGIIDSFDLCIDKSNIEILDQNFCSRILTYYYDTQEFSDELENPHPFYYSYSGITVRLKWIHRIQPDGTNKEYLHITITSKLLKQRYFQGIKKYNILYIYQELMSLKAFKCSYEVFMEGYVSDVDICVNYRISQEAFIRTNQKIITLAKPGFSRYFNFFNEKKHRSDQIINLGLDINSRQKAKPSTPYIKNYFKSIEMLTKSYDFYKEFLQEQFDTARENINNLGRTEYTIRGYKHKKRLLKRGLLSSDYKTLKDLLEIEQSEIKQIIFSGFEDYIHIPERDIQEINITEFSPMEVLIMDYQQQLIALGLEEENLFQTIYRYEGTQRSRLKTKIDKILTHIKTNNLSAKNQLKINAEINQFFDNIKNRGRDRG